MPGGRSTLAHAPSSPARRWLGPTIMARRSRPSAIGRRRAPAVSEGVDRDHLKRAAAERALDFVESGMVIGLGTGSTAAFLIAPLAERIARGLKVVAIPTSEQTAEQARRCGIPLADF